MVVENLIKGYKKFFKDHFVEKKSPIYISLQHDHNPKVLVIACSDARMNVSEFTNSEPGDIFIIRNIANIVPKYCNDNNSHGVSAAIEYAVMHLKIEDIIILGHSNCGGINALINNPLYLPFVSRWMKNISEVKSKLHNHATHENTCKFCEQESIKQSIENLYTFPFIIDALKNNKLQIHGWYFNLKSGILEILENKIFKTIIH